MPDKLEVLKSCETRISAAEAILDQAAREGRKMRADEREACREITNELEDHLLRLQGIRCREAIDEETGKRVPLRRQVPPMMPMNDGWDNYGANTTAAQAPNTWTDARGNPISVYRSTDSMRQAWRGLKRFERDDPKDWNAGRYLRALISGNTSMLSDPERRAMSEGVNNAGGNMVPAPIAQEIIDKARALSVLNRVGALTIPMTSDTLTLARVATDFEFEVKGENEAFSGTDPVLDGIGLTARTFGNVVYASRELAEDAPNFESQITASLSKALAAEIDKRGLAGGTGFTGIMRLPEVQTTGSVGTVAWQDLLESIEDILDKNGTPEAYILPPALATSFDELTTGDGTNSARFYWPAPASVQALTRYVSNQVTAGEIYVGGFRDNAIIGLRHDACIEITTTGGDTFEKHQLGIKIVWRGDFNALHADQLVKLTGAS